MTMAKGSIDRRVVRTREMLHQALRSLILEKGYEAISIKEICAAANVGRSTFYAHYTSKDDLKRSGLESMRKLLVDQQRHSSMREGMAGQIWDSVSQCSSMPATIWASTGRWSAAGSAM